MENISLKEQVTSQIIVVEASAGSGKTYALAKRYLGIIIDPKYPLEYVPLSSILGITFTNKAMVEMKERILELLKKIIFDSFSNPKEEEDLYNYLAVDKKWAKEKALIVMRELIKHYSLFQIQTIDSFINSLLLGCALYIGRSANFKIKTEYNQQLEYCFDTLVDQAQTREDLALFFEDFLQHYLFVENQQGWFPRRDILEFISSLFKLVNKYGQLFKEYPGLSRDLIREKAQVFNQIVELFKTTPEGMNKQTRNSLENFLKNQSAIFEIASLPLALAKPTPAINKNYTLTQEYESKWTTTRENIIGIVEKEAKTVYNPYIRIFRELISIFYDNSKKEDILFLEELNHTASYIFGQEGITVAELYYRLSARFNHYLIDEFQDTSALQWQNLQIMVEEALANGGSLFYVGDKKQAIYRFRGGEPKLFDQVKNSLAYFNLDHKRLTKNWRSQKAIVEFNNQIFSKENLLAAIKDMGLSDNRKFQTGLTQDIENIFCQASQSYHENNNAGYVYLERIKEKNKEELNFIMQEKIIKLIDELKTRFPLEDITILTRDNTEVETVTNWLFKANIAVESEKTLNVLENKLIKEIISLLRFLSSPIDNLSFSSFILGDIFANLIKLEEKSLGEFIFNIRKQGQINSGLSLYNIFRKAYPDLWSQYLEEFFKTSGFLSVYELLVSIYSRFRLMQDFFDSQAFLMKFLEIVKTKEEEYSSITQLLDYFNALQTNKLDLKDCYINVINQKAVKVLTIHKAKGLEFPVVIIPFLRMDISAQTGGRGTSSYIEYSKNNLGLLRISKAYREFSPYLEDIYLQAYSKAFIDELNLMYVALTRPQYELYIFLPQKNGIENNKANYLIPQDFDQIGSKQNYCSNKKPKNSLVLDIPASQPYDWLSGLRDQWQVLESQIDSQIKNHAQIKEGEINHKILSFIKAVDQENKIKIIDKAISDITSIYKRDNLEIYRKKIEQIISTKELQEIFFVKPEEVFCEKEFVNQFGDTKRVDRLIIKDDRLWIVDYKRSDSNKEKKREQIREYIGILKQIYPKKEVKGFIIYLDTISLEEVND